MLIVGPKGAGLPVPKEPAAMSIEPSRTCVGLAVKLLAAVVDIALGSTPGPIQTSKSDELIAVAGPGAVADSFSRIRSPTMFSPTIPVSSLESMTYWYVLAAEVKVRKEAPAAAFSYMFGTTSAPATAEMVAASAAVDSLVSFMVVTFEGRGPQ